MAVSERELEDYICTHPNIALGESVEIIGRQIPLRHGRVDLLAWDSDFGTISVIELKARRIIQKDIAQVTRYFYDVWETLHSIMVTGLMEYQMSIGFSQLWQETFEVSWHGLGDGKMMPVLIGTSIDENTAASAFGAGCQIMIWGHDRDGIWLNYAALPIAEKESPRPPTWARMLGNKALVLCSEREQESAKELRHRTEIISGLLNAEATDAIT